jgi:uncharacterized protein
MKSAALAILVAVLLASCGGSPPTHFVTLTPVAPVGHVEVSAGYPIRVEAVHIPAVLDRNAVVRQTGDNSLSISDQNKWGAPLDEMTRNVLAENLARRMPAGAVVLPGAPAPPSAGHIVVTIVKFREEPNRQVRLEGSWALLEGDSSKPMLICEINLSSEASDSSYDAQAAAMSQLLAQLSDQIASELPTAPAPSSTARTTPSKN